MEGALEGVPREIDVTRLKTINCKSHIKNMYIGNFMYTSVVALLCVVVCMKGGRFPCSCVVWRHCYRGGGRGGLQNNLEINSSV
jgi:hypothetical protein